MSTLLFIIFQVELSENSNANSGSDEGETKATLNGVTTQVKINIAVINTSQFVFFIDSG